MISFLSAVLEVLVVSLGPTDVTLPRDGADPDVSTALFCGITLNTTDYVSTWITPDGDRFSSSSSMTNGKYIVYKMEILEKVSPKEAYLPSAHYPIWIQEITHVP